MSSSESKEYLAFDYHAIRLMIGLIAMLLPLVVKIIASQIPDSISWSYHTDARDCFVGLLFVIGAFLMSYKGHKPVLTKNDVCGFWRWLSRFWKGAINFRIWERKHEEDLVAWIGGIAAWITAVYPTACGYGENCCCTSTSKIHYISAVILFSTIVYFCLVSFSVQAKAKIKKAETSSGNGGIGPKKLRVKLYLICGWGIVVILVGSVVVKFLPLHPIRNLNFWVEALSLELFGFAWLVASQYLPIFTDKTERQKLF